MSPVAIGVMNSPSFYLRAHLLILGSGLKSCATVIKNFKIEREASNLQMPTLSINMAAFPDHGLSPKELLQVAGAAMCLAEAKGQD